MKVMIFGSSDLAERLRVHFECLGHEVSETTSNAHEALDVVRYSRAQLLLLDPNLAFQTAVAAAQEGRDGYGKSIAFIEPADEIVRDVLLDLHPVGILPVSADRGNVAALVAAVRAERKANSMDGQPSPPRDAARGATLRIIATVSTLLAIAVGYFLPNGLPILESSGLAAYLVVVLLALISMGCLVRIHRPVRASLYATAIAVVTVLPTQQ